MLPSNGIDLEQYRTRAKELLKLARAGDPEALERIRTHHPESSALLPSGKLQLADAQLVLAREQGFPSWAKFKDYLLFQQAVLALDTGDIPRLRALVDDQPSLLRYRCRHGEWYESGYFQGAMLLHHVAGNPIRRPLPPNIVEVTRFLLERGADPRAETDTGSKVIELILTGKQPSDSQVALPLIDLLQSAGAEYNPDNPELLTGPLLNNAPHTAEELLARGARMDVRHAAGLGRIADLEALLREESSRPLIEEALAFAAVRDQVQAARVLLEHGAKGDVLVRHGGRNACTALHEAANRGHREIVDLILANGADVTVKDPLWGGTPAGWAEHDGHTEIAALLREYAGARTR